MENAPNIILFWYLISTLFVLMIALIITAINLIRKSREQNTNKMQLLGKICLGIGVICAIPIFLVLGYILYLYIG